MAAGQGQIAAAWPVADSGAQPTPADAAVGSPPQQQCAKSCSGCRQRRGPAAPTCLPRHW
eukprot:2582519-Alexandrium_andersonii.AAC.1